MNIPLFLFAKAPIAGKVKTRLQSHCSAEQSAEIAKILLEESIIKASKYWPGKVYLSVALDAEHPFLMSMLEKYSIELVQQQAGDLGNKMHHTFEEFGYPAAIMGCDAPHIAYHDLQKAYQYLESSQSVLGPSEDGGYYFIGLHKSSPALFSDIDWGTSSVLQSTISISKQIEIEFQYLESLNDVDEWSDLMSVSEYYPALQKIIEN